MKCPNCGNEIEEGHLICETCGNEIRIVPDFEPELENSITETLSTLAAMQKEETAQEEQRQERPDSDPVQEPPEYEEEERMGIGRKIGFTITMVMVTVICCACYFLYTHHLQTISYQVKKAQEYAADENYQQAIAFLDSAFAQDETQSELLFLKADYYYLLSDNESALMTLKQIIDKGIYPYEDIEEAYDKMITIYTKQKRYEDINALLRSCKEDTIVNMFQGYLAKEPEFNYVEGDYAEIIPLKLSSNTSGTIYYTMDGSEPDENSQIYTAPLFLEDGEYTISAFFVNDYGIKSNIVTKTYHISLDVPNAPEVSLYSGEYTQPVMITVVPQEGCQTFYTTDESEPTRDSVPYTGPIPMPLGTTNFRFINVSEAGVYSEVTQRTYTLSLHSTISTDEAVQRLIDRLVEIGYLKDTEGRLEQQSGTYSYQFSSVLMIGEDIYFTINEYSNDGTGLSTRTDKVFLIQVYTGAPARLGYDEDGNFAAVPI